MNSSKPVCFLAIETSCDETSAAVVFRRGHIARVASNVVASQVALHAKTGGVVPEVAAREHVRPIVPTIQRALAEAGTNLSAVKAIAVTHGPGLHTALLVGVETARTLALAANRPLLGVNHLHGHLAANWNGRAPRLPAVGLIVSGGHTELVLVRSDRTIVLLGQTRDDAAGEAFDKVAQLLGLGYPGGLAISRAATTGNPRAYDLPRPMLTAANLDFSFAGLKTAVRYLVDRNHAIGRSSRATADLAASFQAAVIDVLVTKTVRAVEQYRPREVLLAGGVAANRLLRRRLAAAVRTLPGRPSYHQPPFELCTDNAGMIGLAAALLPASAVGWQALDIEPVLAA